MKRQLPKARSIARRKYHKEPKHRLIIVCEGEKTEPFYLKNFSYRHSNNLIELEIIPKGGAPITIVDNAVDRYKTQRKIAAKSGDSFESFFDVWAVFDKDVHPNIPQAMNKATDNNVHVALSNPCFEIWGLFHFEDQDAPIHRHKLQSKLSKLMKGYKPASGKTFNCGLLVGKYDDARKRALLSLARREEENDPRGNPSTNIHELLDLIKKYGKN